MLRGCPNGSARRWHQATAQAIQVLHLTAVRSGATSSHAQLSGLARIIRVHPNNRGPALPTASARAEVSHHSLHPKRSPVCRRMRAPRSRRNTIATRPTWATRLGFSRRRPATSADQPRPVPSGHNSDRSRFGYFRDPNGARTCANPRANRPGTHADPIPIRRRTGPARIILRDPFRRTVRTRSGSRAKYKPKACAFAGPRGFGAPCGDGRLRGNERSHVGEIESLRDEHPARRLCARPHLGIDAQTARSSGSCL
jgi:hypothetical protein